MYMALLWCIEVQKLFCVFKGLSRGYMLLTKSHSRPTILYRFSAQVSITRPGQFVNTTMADIIKVWQDYVSEQLDDNGTDDDDDDDDDDELLASAVHYLMKTLGSFDYSDILLTTQVFHWFLCCLFSLALILCCSCLTQFKLNVHFMMAFLFALLQLIISH